MPVQSERPLLRAFQLLLGGLFIAGLLISNSFAGAGSSSNSVKNQSSIPAGMVVLGEYKLPGIEVELSGIYPHPTDDGLYLVAANKNPAYRAGQHPVLPEQYRGKLLTVRRNSGEIVKAFDLVGGNYGGIAYDGHFLYVANAEPPEILKVSLDNGQVLSRIPVSGPVGGLKYNAQHGVLLAQLFLEYPHLAVVDPKTRATIKTLWSDESAMDLVVVGNSLLCTWASGPDAQAYSELRLLNESTGKVEGRVRLDAVHTSAAELDPRVSGVVGFIAMVTTDRNTGTVVMRKYGIDVGRVPWVR